ncbi:MAG: IS1 family transposase [Turicibacter sp.]|nr:IS1 family transposase [Turicibacter sp.]
MQVNTEYIETNRGKNIQIDLIKVEEAEMDEMWSFVHDKSQQYWLWWAIDHNTQEVLAYVFGTRQQKFLGKLCDVLSPFDIKVTYTDDNYAYQKICQISV